jgi:hypothetical protein
MLLQKQDNSISRTRVQTNTTGFLFVAPFLIKKSCRSFISNTVTLKAGLLTKPIVKGAFLEPGELMVVIPLAKQISIMLCAIFGVYHCINLNTKLQTCNPFSLISAVFLNFEQINNSWKSRYDLIKRRYPSDTGHH